MRFMITFASALAVVTVVATLAIGTVTASSAGSSHYTQQGLRADGLRLQAMARRYAYLQHRPAASFYTPSTLNAMGLRWLAMARAYAHPQVSALSSDEGFDWADAGIGAASGSALVLCLAVLLGVVRRPRETKLAS